MLDNYEKLSNGVIRQINRKPFQYSIEYSGKYNNYAERGRQLAFVRLGVLMGALGHIPNSILDVGYGNGDFLLACTNIIKDCNGHDITKFPLPEKCTFVDNMFDRHYDVVTFFDALEHFEDINVIKNLNCDYIMITVPWCHYFSTEWFDKWYHRRPDEHLWHFNDVALRNFFDEIGYECLFMSNFEDTIRVNANNKDCENILGGVFKKK